MASPDHYQAQLITEAGVFYAKLTKWEQYFGDLPVHVIPEFLYCYLSFRTLQPVSENAIVFDISEVLEKKLAAISCYKTQFPPAKAHFLERIRAYAEQQGMAAGFTAGEVLGSPGAIGTRDLMGFLFAVEGPR